MIKDAIKKFPEQFKYEPEIINADKLGQHDSYVIGGMGGSGLVAGIIRASKPELDIAAHHEYGLPTFLGKEAKKRLFIAISYSGNTEETISFFEEALKGDLPVAAISTGGKLIELAKSEGVTYIELPDTGIQPRMSLGYMLRAVLKLMGEGELFDEAGKLADTLKPDKYEPLGKELTETLYGSVPVIYSSRRNQTIAYNWKIKFNETGKIPAFYNVFPELNHNEMTGFDVSDATKELSEKIHFIFIEDDADHPRIKKRMKVTSSQYVERGFTVSTFTLEGKSVLEKIFVALLVADWTAFYTAEKYGNEPEQVPMVEEFKKLIA